jgi:hypothetical protein
MRSIVLSFLALGISIPALRAADTLDLEVDAGAHERADTPLIVDLPPGWAAGREVALEAELDGGRLVSVPCQIVAGENPGLAWIVRDLPAGAKRLYRARRVLARPRAGDTVVAIDDGASLRFRFREHDILAYRYATTLPETGFEPEFARSGYIHPVWSPAGAIVTNDFPPLHKHHHGIWAPWTSTVFEGRKVDFWNSGAKEGRIEFVGLDERGGGPVFGQLRARHRFVDLTAPGGSKVVLDETWSLRVWALADHFVFDLESTQTCATDSPLELKEYLYGGLGLRGSGEWEGEGEACRFLTSEGKTRADGHATRARWCDVRGDIGDRTAGVTVLCHPGNFRFPQHMRIHPSEPFFNFAPCQAGDFEIRRGTPYISRYRFLVYDGETLGEKTERFWNDYAEPPRVRVVE